MNKLVKGIAIVAGAIGVVKSIEQRNNQMDMIVKLMNENQETERELVKLKIELERRIKRLYKNLSYSDKMRMLDKQRIKELDNKIFELKTKQIDLESAQRIAAN
jgi:hypothetical protein